MSQVSSLSSLAVTEYLPAYIIGISVGTKHPIDIWVAICTTGGDSTIKYPVLLQSIVTDTPSRGVDAVVGPHLPLSYLCIIRT